MDLIKVMERFPDQESCIAYLEKIRWKGKPHCPHCGSTGIGRRTETEEGRIGRWNCYDCQASFKVTCGTVFHGAENSTPEVVSGYLVDCERKEKFIKSSTGSRSKFESKDILVYHDAYTR